MNHIILLILLLGIAFSSKAQEWEVAYGATTLASTSIFKQSGNNTLAVPFIDAKYGKWHLGSQYGIFQFQITDENNPLSIRIGGGIRDERFDSIYVSSDKQSKNRVFNDYESGDLDITATLNIQWKEYSFSLAQDVAGHSKSLTGHVDFAFLNYPFSKSLTLQGKVGIKWYQKGFINYVYGVDEENTYNDVGRTFYESDKDAINKSLSLNLVYQFSRHWLFVSQIETEFVAKEIFESPLVDEKQRHSAHFSFIYRWSA